MQNKIFSFWSVVVFCLLVAFTAQAFSVAGLGCKQTKTGTEFFGTVSGLAQGQKTNIYFELLLGKQKFPLKINPDKSKTVGNGYFSFPVSNLFAGKVCKDISSIKVYIKDGKAVVRAEEKGVFYEKCCYASSQYKGRTAIIFNSQRQTTGYPFKIEGTGKDNLFENISVAMNYLDENVFPDNKRAIQQCNGVREDRMQGINASFVIDTSGSMDLPLGPNSKLEQAKNVFVNIARKQLIQNDKASVLGIAFANTIVPLTGNKEQVAQGILKLKALGDTRLFDAIVAGIRQVAVNTAQKRAVIVFTDGNENDSRQYKNYKDVINIAKANNVKVFPIGMGQPGSQMAMYKGRLIQVGLDTKTLSAIATGTGGKFYQIKDISEIFKIFEEVASQTRISNQLPLCEAPKLQPQEGRVIIASGATANDCDGSYFIDFLWPENISGIYNNPINVSLNAGADVSALGGLKIESSAGQGNFKLVGKNITGTIPAKAVGSGKKFRVSFNFLLNPGTTGKGDNVEILSSASRADFPNDNDKMSLQGYAYNLDINCSKGSPKVDLMIKPEKQIINDACGAKVKFIFKCVRADGSPAGSEDICPQFTAMIGSSEAVKTVSNVKCISGESDNPDNCYTLVDNDANSRNKNIIAAQFPKGAVKGGSPASLTYDVDFAKNGSGLEITQKGSTIDYIELPDGSAVKNTVSGQTVGDLYLGNNYKAEKCGQKIMGGGLKLERIVEAGDTCNSVKITIRAKCETLPCPDVFVQEYFPKDYRELISYNNWGPLSIKGADSNIMGSLRAFVAGQTKEMNYIVRLKGDVGQQVSTLNPDSYYALGNDLAQKFGDEKFTIKDCQQEVKAKMSITRSLELAPCGNSITARLKIKCDADPSSPNCGKVVIYEKLQSGASLNSIMQRNYGFMNKNLVKDRDYNVQIVNGEMKITINLLAASAEEFFYYFDLDNPPATGEILTHSQSIFDYNDGLKGASGQISGDDKVVKTKCEKPQLKASREIILDKCSKFAKSRLVLECVKGSGPADSCCGSAIINDTLDQKIAIYNRQGKYIFSDILISKAPDLNKNLTPSQFGATLPVNGLCQGERATLEYGIEFKNFGEKQTPHNASLSNVYYNDGQGDKEIKIESAPVNVGGADCLQGAKRVEVKLPCTAKVPGNHNIAMSFDLSGSMFSDSSIAYAKAGAMAFLEKMNNSVASSKYRVAINYFAHISKDDMVHSVIDLSSDKKAVWTALGNLDLKKFTNGGTSIIQGINLAIEQLAASAINTTKNVILITNGSPNVDANGNRCDSNDTDKKRYGDCIQNIFDTANILGKGLNRDGIRLYVINYGDKDKTNTQKQNDMQFYSFLTNFEDGRIFNVSGTGGNNEFELAFMNIDNIINSGAQCFNTNVSITLPKDRLQSVADIFGGYEGVNKEKGASPVDRTLTYDMIWRKLEPFSGSTTVTFITSGDFDKYKIADGLNYYAFTDELNGGMSYMPRIFPENVTITDIK